MTEYEFHPFADIFPLLEDAALTALADDITANGQREAVVLFEGKILDGRNRALACKRAGIDPKVAVFRGSREQALAAVVSWNLHRRHLNESQRGMVGADIKALYAVLARERQAHGQTAPGRTLSANLREASDPTRKAADDAAAMVNVSPRTVEYADKVRTEATPALVAAVRRGEIAVSLAAKLADAEPEFQERVVEKVRAEQLKPTEAARRVRAEIVAERAPAAAPSGRHRVIYADPPWSYGNTQPDYHPEQRDHYPVMSMAQLEALDVAALAEEDAVLFLWATSPILPEALDLTHKWGFTYKASFVWDKVAHNMGHYNSVRHEFLLLCTRGSCQPDVRKLFDSVVTIERGKHSEKPEYFREIIDTIYPNGRRIELFARKRVRGWEAYGYEA